MVETSIYAYFSFKWSAVWYSAELLVCLGCYTVILVGPNLLFLFSVYRNKILTHETYIMMGMFSCVKWTTKFNTHQLEVAQNEIWTPWKFLTIWYTQYTVETDMVVCTCIHCIHCLACSIHNYIDNEACAVYAWPICALSNTVKSLTVVQSVAGHNILWV